MKSKKIIIAAVLIAAISGLLFCPQIRQAIADFSFLQTDWSGGASSDTAVHPDNQTGWQNYSSKDSNVDTSFPGKVTMSKLEGEIIDDTDADFAKGTLDNLQIVGTGTGAKVEVIANVEDLFCDSIGHWVNQYHMPAFDYGATFTRVTDYPNAGDDYIYAFFSNWSARTVFGRFNVTTNNWTFLADFPKAISPGWGQGASLCYPGSGDYIYALRGSYTKDFYRYSITNDTWEKLRDIPEAVWTGGSLAARDSTAIFAIVRKESSDFYMYDTSGDVWIQKADTPWSVGESGNIVYPGSGDYIYLMRGWGGYCARYHIDFNTWSSIASSFSVTYGASFVYPGQGDYIYATSGVDRTNFARFSITAQSWESLSSLPVKQSRWRPYFYYTVDGTEPKINMLLANYTRPLKFDLTNLRWDEPCSPPDTPNWSGRMAWDGGDYIYYIRGSGSKVFYRYSISNNKWERLANSILYYGNGGGGITYYNGKIYSWEGGNRSGFAEYDPATDTWTSLANTPSTMYWGCVMQGAQDAGEDYIYALRGNKTSTFWRYKISTNTWEAMADVPGSVWEGGCLLYPGTGDYMYATRGYSSTDFYRYSISNNTWEALANVDGPKRNGIRSQDTLVYSATTPDYIYWMRSTSQGWSYSPLDMARYSISNDTWERLDDKPFPGISVYAATDNYIYAVSNWQGGLWRYDLATQKWTDPAEATEALYGGIYGGNNMVYVGGDYAYLVGAYGGDYPRSWYRYIWKYKISEDRYEKMIEIPFHTGYSTKAVYPGSGNFIYILQGMGTKHLWRFDVVNETFTQLADAPVRIGWGASFGGSGDRLFAVRGDNTQTFMQYTISTNTWQILTDTPSSIESRPSQNSLVYPGGDYVYLHRGGGSGTFWAYNITTASWFNLAGTIGFYETNLYYPGSDNYIYAVYRGRFFRYSIIDNSWTELARVPPQSGGVSLFYPGSGDTLYAICSRTDVMRYSISQDTWDQPVGLPYRPGRGSDMVALNDGGTIFYRPGDSRNYFYRYSVSDCVWTQDANSPTNVDEWSASMTTDGKSYVYATRGRYRTNFWRYSVARNTWEVLASPPADFRTGHDIAYKDGFVYAIRGESTTFWRYNPSADSWTVMADVPGRVGWGGMLVAGNRNYLYCLRGNGSSDFYRYDIASNSWTTLTSLPRPVGWGSYGGKAICYPGFGDYIYVIPGSVYGDWYGESKGFFRYSISQDAWEEIESTPAPARGTNALVYPGEGSYMYGYRGGYDSFEFWKYLAFIYGTYTSEIKEIGNNAGFNTITWAINGDAEVKVRTSNYPDMSDAMDWDDCPGITKGDDLSNYVSVVDGHKYLQYQVKLICYDLSNLPALDSIAITYEYYPHKQSLISNPYNSTYANNRIMGISWLETQPAGTDIRFQLRTGPDLTTLETAPWLGPGGIQTFNDDYSTATDYTYAPEIEVVDGVARLKKIYEEFAYTQRIVLDNSEGETSYTDTVVIIEITSSNKDFWEHVKSDGSDVRFCDEEGNFLSYNLHANNATFDYNNKYAKIFVKVPSIPAGQKSTIYLKYGKADAVSASDETVVGSIPQNGLVGYWKFDEGSGTTAYDSSGQGNNGTLVNGPTWVDGKFGDALKFDGSNDYVSTPLNIDQSGSSQGVTMVAWVYPTSTSSGRHEMISSDNGGYDWSLLREGGTWYVFTGENSRSTGFSVDLNQWQHVVAVFIPGTGVKFYKNGQETTISYISYDTSDGNIRIGCRSGGGEYFGGIIDEVAIYKRVLSDSEIQLLYHCGGGGVDIPYFFYTLEEEAASPSLSGWNKRLTVRIDNSSGSKLTDYQVKVNLTSSQESFWEACRNDGYDIRFIDSDNETILDYWRESFDYDNKTASLWVRVPEIPGGAVHTIYLYYGRSDAADASSYDNTMTKDFGEVGYNTSGINLDGADDYITVPHSSSLDISTSVTLEANVRYIADTWLPGFGYRKKVTLDNSGGTAKEDVVCQFTVTHETGKMNSDFSDLRFVDTDGTKLRYKIKDYTADTSATVLVIIPYLPASTKDIYMYYGNANATSESDETVGGIPQNGLVGYWKFDEGSGSETADSSGYGNTGTINGASWTAGKYGNGLSFDGSNDYVDCGNGSSLDITDAITIGAWIYPLEQSSRYRTVISKGSNGVTPFDIRMNRTSEGNHIFGKIQTSAGSVGTPSVAINNDQWYYVTLLYNGTKVELFLNGVSQGSNPHSGTININDVNLMIGRNTSSEYWKGIIDEVTIYNRALSEAEILRAGGESFSFTPTFGAEEAQPAIDQTIISKSGTYELKFTQSGLTGLINGTEIVSTVSYSTNIFIHTALVYDGSEVKLLVDGAEKASTALAGAINTNTNDLVIGNGIKGTIDEVRVWNIARSTGAINGDKRKYLNGDESGLVMYLRCNENTGTVAYDATINGNNGELLNGAGWYLRPFAYSNEKPNCLYHFDEGAGSAATDSSGNNNTAMIYNGSFDSTDLTGFFGDFSISFNGTNTYLEALDSPSLDVTGAITVEAWIKPAELSGERYILQKGDDSIDEQNYAFYLSAGQLVFSFYNGEYKVHQTDSSGITENNPYYVVATFDEATDTVRIYVNGEERYSAEETSTLLANNGSLKIGKAEAGNFFRGLIDEVRVYSRVLSAEEIKAHYEHRRYAMFKPEPTLYFDYEPEVIPEIGAYVSNNPVVQPVLGVFYTDKNIAEFAEIANKPYKTDIKYQVSKDGYKWYWFDGTDWAVVTEGYSQANTASEINTNLAAFQNNIATEGDFYYRAFLHSEPESFNTPSLDNIAITLVTGETFYVEPSGATAINPLHTDANNDQYFQYKTIFYSEGSQTAILDEATLEYIDAYVTITAPNGGESYNVGEEVDIIWTSQAIDGATGTVALAYSVDGGNTYELIADNLPNTGSYTWTVPDDPTMKALIRISSEDFPAVSDTSDAVFSIMSIRLTSPNGGEIWEEGKTHNITWQTYGTIPASIVKLEYSTDNGSNWTQIAGATADDGLEEWPIPEGIASDQMLIRISATNDPNIFDVSDAVFSVVPTPEITITSPAGGEGWIMGSQQTISWRTNSLQFSDSVILSYSTDDFSTETEIEAGISIGTPQGSDNNDDIVGSYQWTVPEIVSDSVKVKVKEESVPTGRDTQQLIYGTSNAFSITEPTITVTAPQAGTVWVAGDTEDITWTTEGSIGDNLTIEYRVGASGNWTEIATNETNDGTYTWANIPQEAVGDNEVYIRVTDTHWNVSGISEPFTILALARVTIIQPNGGETLIMGSQYNITWTTDGNALEPGGDYYDKLNFYYSTDGGNNYTLFDFHSANTGTKQWNVPEVETSQALVKIVVDGLEGVEDTSDAVFTIMLPTITITSPNGGEAWYATGSYDITWTSEGSVSDNLLIEYYDGSSWHTIASGEANDGIYTWHPVADIETDAALIRITDNNRTEVFDTSDAAFTIITPYITVSAPNGGEEYVVGTSHNITWDSGGYEFGAISDNLTIQYSTDNGDSWTNLSTAEANDGTYTWDSIPDTPSSQCLVRIFDADRPATSDQSDANFSIVLPYIRIISPNGGEEWPIGTNQTITWTSLGTISDNLLIEYSKDNFVDDIHTIATGEANDGTYPWTVPDDYSTTVKVRITDNNRTEVFDTSDAAFTIAYPVITITSPNGGELWTVGDEENITWTSLGTISDNLLIEYSKDNFVDDIHTIATGEANDGTYPWTIPDDTSTTVKVRITDNNRTAVWDKSDATFSILPVPVITITTPTTGDVWRLGTEQTITWTDNGGIISNNLTIQVSTDGTNYSDIASGIANTGSYSWTVPDDSSYVSTTCFIKIFDASRPTTEAISEQFTIAYPLITITSPNGGEVWAAGDEAPITWTTTGAVTEDNLTLEYSPDGGATYYVVETGEANDGTYTWTVPDNPSSNVLFRIKDANRPTDVVDVSDAVFTIISQPIITIEAPNGGEEYVLGDTINISWNWQGLSISDNLMIDYALEGDFDTPSKRYIIASSGVANEGNYAWTITEDALTGSTLVLRITDASRTEITDQSDGYFRIRGGFNLTSPTSTADWMAKSTQTITWETQGSIPTVNLQYSTDGGTTWSAIANAVANTGSYSWTLPDVQSDNAKVRVLDYTDNTVADTSDTFNIVYATVKFKILDYDTMEHLSELNVDEPATGWSVTDNSLTSPITRTEAYPYGSYTTFFTKEDYIDNSVTWTTPASGTSTYVVTLYMESKAAAQVSWEAILTYSYAPATDTLTAVGSLQRKGKLVGTMPHELANLGSATLTIYNPDYSVIATLTCAQPNQTTAMYDFTLTNTGFEAGKVYPATLTIIYNEREYTSNANIDVGSEILQYEFFTETAEQLATSVTRIESAVAGGTAEMKSALGETEAKIKSDLAATKSEIKADTGEILTAVEETIPTGVAETKEKVETMMKSEILNRENTIRSGDELIIRYRTYSGLSPVIDVYDPNNVPLITKGIMKEIGTTGIYEYPVKFKSSWGRGDFTIVCSESTKGTLDALSLSVLSTDIEAVAGDVGALLGITADLPDIGDITASLQAQIAIVEDSLSKLKTGIGEDLTESLKELETVYSQLSAISEQVKSLAGESKINLDKLYEVSKDKANDINYLINKSQELKAAIELNQKLLEDVSREPITQTWYEYK